MRYQPAAFCQVTEYSAVQVNRNDSQLIVLFPEPQEIRENGTETVIVSTFKRNETRVVRMVDTANDDFFDISLPDLILSVATLLTILLMVIQMVMKCRSTAPDLTIRKYGLELTETQRFQQTRAAQTEAKVLERIQNQTSLVDASLSSDSDSDESPRKDKPKPRQGKVRFISP